MTNTPGLGRRVLLRGLAVVSALALGGTLSAGTASATQATLPFPTDPGGFLSAGITKAFGSKIPVNTATPAAVLQMAGQPEPMSAAGKGTLTVDIGEGVSKLGKKVLQPAVGTKMTISAFSMDFTGDAGELALRLDPARPAPSELRVLDPASCAKRFGEVFYNPLKWPQLTADYARDPAAFFGSHLGIFFPAHNDLNVNVTATSGKHPGVTLVNKDVITLRNGSAKEFPPKDAGYAPTAPIHLVDAKNPTGPALITIDRMNTIASP